MNRTGPIIIIEDDIDDQDVLEAVFTKLQVENERVYFLDGISALAFLQRPTLIPFLILSDINLPKLNGLELRDKLKNDADLAIKCIPYLYFSTALNQRTVIDAYSKSAQGFFVKGNTMTEVTETISVIIEYWKRCAAPNNFL